MSRDGNIFHEFAIKEVTVEGVSEDGNSLMVCFPGEQAQATSSIKAQKIEPLFSKDSGISTNLEEMIGSKAIGCRLATSDQFLILGFKRPRFQSIQDFEAEDTIPAGTSKLPVADGKDVIISGADAELRLDLGGYSLIKPDGSGIYLKNINSDDFTKSSYKLYSHSQETTSAACIMRHGEVYRFPDGSSSLTIEEGPNNDLGGSILVEGYPRGFFPGNYALDLKIGSKPRNIALTEYRQVINEFPPYVAFNGIENEALKCFSDEALDDLYKNFDKIRQENDDKSVLVLGKNQIIECIAGNVIDRYGSSLDINYMKLSYGGPLGSVPNGKHVQKFKEAQCITRRGIAYHFLVSTNTELEQDGPKSTNFTFAIDKEGLLKLNVPKSSDTGNIPFSCSSNPNLPGRDRTSLDIDTKEEKIPVTLRNDEGKVILPIKTSSGKNTRSTGVRYSNQWGYFPGDSDYVRVSSTKHHNMYATAEMLIANTITEIYIPSSSADPEDGVTSGVQSKPRSFERIRVPPSPKDGKSESSPTHETCASVIVKQGQPAISTGGATVVCGKSYELDESRADGIINNPVGNNFLVKESDEVTVSIEDSARPVIPSGGKSAHVNLEGSLEMSVGKDNTDEKSIMLDTAGSLIAWFGMDRQGRSAVVQTDGDLAINVGGNNGDSWRAGRFDLRVNVTDKGVITSKNPDKPLMPNSTEPGINSDYIISISSQGLVIAGASGKKMLIRNKGDILLESTNTLTLSGTKVMVREGGLSDRPIGKDTVSKDTQNANEKGVKSKLNKAKEKK